MSLKIITTLDPCRLLELKKQYQDANGGVPYGPPPSDGKKSKKDKGESKAAPEQPEKTGPSKGVRDSAVVSSLLTI